MQKRNGKYAFIMILCCLVPVAAVVILKKYFNIGNYSILLVFLCPLGHVFLMKFFKPKENKKGEKTAERRCH